MGYCASTYRISFPELLRIRGCRDSRLLAEVVEGSPDEDVSDDYDEDEDHPPPFSAAVASIINDEAVADGYWPTYADAATVFYERLGVFLDSNAISPSQPQFLAQLNDAFTQEGLGDAVPIFNFARTPPLLTEPPEPFPVVGHMTPEEVAAVGDRVTKVDWAKYGPDVAESAAMVANWIAAAQRYKQGLVCVYS